MPVKMRKVRGGKGRVSTPGGVKAKATTVKKWKAQERLLNAVEHGWRPTGKKSGKSALGAGKKKSGGCHRT